MADQDYSELEDFAKSGTAGYIKFDESGEPIEGVYLGFELEDDNFNPGEKRPVYNIEIDHDKKALGSSSKRLARAMLAARPKVGDFIRITRTGDGYDTNYAVETSDIPF
jgi:hypothetical protein